MDMFYLKGILNHNIRVFLFRFTYFTLIIRLYCTLYWIIIFIEDWENGPFRQFTMSTPKRNENVTPLPR